MVELFGTCGLTHQDRNINKMPALGFEFESRRVVYLTANWIILILEQQHQMVVVAGQGGLKKRRHGGRQSVDFV
jgi:hypothetical protein